jgi:UTP:GlnB (protein PII) uridylyltransferase
MLISEFARKTGLTTDTVRLLGASWALTPETNGSGGSLDERLRSWTRLADGAVIGLSYLARLSVDAEARSMVAPFAVLAVGAYGARRCGPDSVFELQYVLPEDQRSWERSGRIVAFIRIGLTELGLAHYRDAVGTAVACACVARGDPVVAARFATARFLSGRYGLYAGFAGVLVEPRSAAGSTPTCSNRRPSDINAGEHKTKRGEVG